MGTDESIFPTDDDQIRARLALVHASAERLGLLLRLAETSGDRSEAEAAASEALRLALADHDMRSAASALLARALRRSREAALTDANEAYEIFELLRLDAEAAAAAMFAGSVCEGLDKPEDALRWYSNAGRLLEDDDPARGNALLAVGRVASRMGDYPAALEAQLGALAVYEANSSSAGIGRAHLDIGLTDALSGDHASAFDHLQESVAWLCASGDRGLEASALGNLGSTQVALGRLDDALESEIKALAALEELGDAAGASAGLAAIGDIHMRKGDIAAAQFFLERARQKLSGVEDRELYCTILLRIGKIYAALGLSEDGRFVLEQGLEFARELGDRWMEIEFREALSSVCETLAQLAPALSHTRRAATLRCDLAGIEKQRALAELQVRFDLEKAVRDRQIYQLKLAQLEGEMRLKQTELTSMALTLVQKKELLDELKQRVRDLRNGHEGTTASLVDQIVDEINATYGGDETWGRFTRQLDSVHHEFLHSLTERFPALSPTELKICSLTRLNLSIKAIADLLCISPRTIETHRSNIRRKMGVSRKENLTTLFLGM